MATDPTLRMKIEAELRLGKTSRELESKYGVNYQSISGWKRELDKEVAEMDVETLRAADEVTLHAMAEEIRHRPIPPREIDKALTVIEGAVGLQRLEEKTRELSFGILSEVEGCIAEAKLNDKLDLKALREAAGIVATLHTAMFSKNITQVNVLNNNNVSEEKREIFRASLRS